jgi:hypothetical protein
VAPFWCESVKKFYEAVCPIAELKGPNITGDVTGLAVKTTRDVKKDEYLYPYIGNIQYLSQQTIRQMKQEGTADHLLEVRLKHLP